MKNQPQLKDRARWQERALRKDRNPLMSENIVPSNGENRKRKNQFVPFNPDTGMVFWEAFSADLEELYLLLRDPSFWCPDEFDSDEEEEE